MDETVMEMSFKYSVDGEETYDGVACWLQSMTQTYENTKTVITWWMSKDEFKPVHGRMRVYTDDTLTFQTEFDPTKAPPGAGEAPEPVDVQYTVGQETVTVIAGTFVNCAKMEVTAENLVTDTWVHPDVPIWGIVKTEAYKDGKLFMTMELKSYGG